MSDTIEVAATSVEASQEDVVSKYVEMFITYSQKTASSIVKMGEVVCEAKAELDPAEYDEFAKKVGIKNPSSLRKYERIGVQAAIFNEFVEFLPHCWTSVYTLSMLKSENLQDAFEQNKIFATMSGEEASQLAVSYGDKKQNSNLNKPAEPAAESVPDTSYSLSVQFSTTPTRELVQELQQLIDDFFKSKSALFELGLSDLLQQVVNPSQPVESEA